MLKKKIIIENPQKIWEIIMSIYIIGLINIYLIHTYGLEVIFPAQVGNITEELGGSIKDIWENINCGGILKINEINLFFLIFINLLFLVIFNIISNNKFKYKYLSPNYIGIYSIEYIYIISFGLLGLNIIVLGNDLIFIFIAIELYSISVYLLILLKITKNTSRLSIIYLLINSLSSYIFLLGISLIYKYSGSIILDEIMYILNNSNNGINPQKINIGNGISIGVLLLVLGILLKLGTVPFNFWVLRLYTRLTPGILLYQIIIPKLVFVYLLYKILKNIYILPPQMGYGDKFIEIGGNIFFNINFFFILLFTVSIASVIIGSIAGLYHTNFKSILTYSSILNMGFILLGLSNELIKNQTQLGGNISFFEYLLIYTFNTFSLFFCLLLISPNKNFNFSFGNKYPFFSMCLLFSIFSFIGIPPFAGFYAKLNIFINILYSYNPLWMITIFFLLISTFISACFYLKFILNFFFPPTPQPSLISSSIPLPVGVVASSSDLLSDHTHLGVEVIPQKEVGLRGLISETPLAISYFFSFFSLFLILYPFLSNYIYPFFFIL